MGKRNRKNRKRDEKTGEMDIFVFGNTIVISLGDQVFRKSFSSHKECLEFRDEIVTHLRLSGVEF